MPLADAESDSEPIVKAGLFSPVDPSLLPDTVGKFTAAGNELPVPEDRFIQTLKRPEAPVPKASARDCDFSVRRNPNGLVRQGLGNLF